MLHKERIWCLSIVESAAELASMLTEQTWCSCSAFIVSNDQQYVWLNDSTSADGAQKYAVCKIEQTGEIRQLDSITFSWCDSDQALAYIQSTLQGNDDVHAWAHLVIATLETSEQHQRCPYFA